MSASSFRTAAIALVLCLCAIQTLANSYGAGSINNKAIQQSIFHHSKKLVGNYYIKNVATGQFLWYTTNPQTIIPVSGKKTAMHLSTFEVGTQIKPVPSDVKCLAAQFNSAQGVDWAATMYHCRNSQSKNHDRGDVQTKQQWHFYPVSGKSNTYYIIAEDHLSDMISRAMTGKKLKTAGGYMSTALAVWNKRDKKQMWVVTKC